MISQSTSNCNTFSPPKRNIVQIIEDFIRRPFNKNNNKPKKTPKKDRHIYIPPAGASVARAATMALLCKKIQEKFLENKKNSFVYSIHGTLCNDGTQRTRRLSRRETICVFQQILISSYNIATGEIYSNLVYKTFAQYAEVSERTIKRLFALFKKRGWIDVVQNRKLDKYGNYFSLPAVKYLRMNYFKQVLGEWAWEKIKQYKRVWEKKHGIKKIENGTQIDINNPMDWKTEAITPYLKKQKKLDQEPRMKILRSVIGNPESHVYRTNKWQEDAADESKVQIAPVYSASAYPSTEIDNEYVPQTACHKDFVAPSKATEQDRESARRHLAAMRAKMGMKPSTAPPS